MQFSIKDQDTPIKSTRLPKVAILMCTYNGAKYLPEQLDSIASQTCANWELWVSDDGSDDETRSILEAYMSKWGNEKLHIQAGPRNGFVKNFISLAHNRNIEADFFAFSDQDDIWESDKLESAISWLHHIPENVAGLYSTRTLLVDADNNEIGLSPLFTKQPSFENSLVQPIGGANTMVFNNSARKLLLDIDGEISIPSHDWLLYMVVSGCGGKVTYDSKPSVRYRQHSENLMGRNCNLNGKILRAKWLLKGRFKEWNDANMQILFKIKGRLTPKHLESMAYFANSRKRWLLPRLIGLWRSGVYRQTTLGNIGLVVAAIFNKI